MRTGVATSLSAGNLLPALEGLGSCTRRRALSARAVGNEHSARTSVSRIASLWPILFGLGLTLLAGAEPLQPGHLDPDFFPGPQIEGSVYAVAVQANGRIILGGDFRRIHGVACRWLARLHPNNDLDAEFTSSVALDGPAEGIVSDIVVLPNDKVLIAGDFLSIQGVARNGIARLHADGALDTTFDPAAGASGVWTLAVRPDGRILLGGGFLEVAGVPRSGIAQLLSDGRLDPAFDPGRGADDFVTALLIEPDGKVVVGGLFSSLAGGARNGVGRLLADGTLDVSFDVGSGVDGIVLTLARASSGQIIVGGAFTQVDFAQAFGMARLWEDGYVDTSFKGGRFNGAVWHAVVSLDGKIVAAGEFTTVDSKERGRVVRLEADGSFDYTFNPLGGADEAVLDFALLPDGRCCLAGEFRNYSLSPAQGIARVLENGSPDPEFPTGIGPDNHVRAITVDPHGEIYLGGAFAAVYGVPRQGLARLQSDGRLDINYAPTFSQESRINAVLLQPGGLAIIGGDFTQVNGTWQRSLARLHTDGTLDSSWPTSVGNTVTCLAQQPDGKILVGGVLSFDWDRLWRLNSDGTMDASFLRVGWGNEPTSLFVQADGGILMGNRWAPFLSRHATNGALDEAFMATLDLKAEVRSVYETTDGTLMIAGAPGFVTGTGREVVARLSPRGVVDETFSHDSMMNEGANALLASLDTQLYVGGSFYPWAAEGLGSFRRLNADGTTDAAFQVGTGPNYNVYALASQQDGKILVGGDFTEYDGVTRHRLLRVVVGSATALNPAFVPGTARWTAADGFQVQLTAPAGGLCSLETSNDAEHWTVLSTHEVPPSGSLLLNDPDAKVGNIRMYRATQSGR